MARRSTRSATARDLPPPGPLHVRKYSNRRLYDQTRSRSLRQEDLYDLVVAGYDVEVRDSATDRDITNLVLAQALMERDPTKLAAFPPAMLHLLIRTNERLLQGFLNRYFAGLAESFLAMRRQFESIVTDGPPVAAGSYPAHPFDWAMAAFRAATGAGTETRSPSSSGAMAALEAEVRELRERLERLDQAAERAPRRRTGRSTRRNRAG